MQLKKRPVLLFIDKLTILSVTLDNAIFRGEYQLVILCKNQIIISVLFLRSIVINII
jgi:hypothetical protein